MFIKPQERGSALIIAFTVLIVLTVLGTMVMDTVSGELDTAGAERASQDSLYNTEAGIAWAVDTLSKLPLKPNDGQSFEDNLWVPLAPAVASADSDCDLLGCTSRDWFLLNNTDDPKAFGTGSFRVFVADDEVADDINDTGNGVIMLRAIGSSTGNVRRMIEIVLTPVGT